MSLSHGLHHPGTFAAAADAPVAVRSGTPTRHNVPRPTVDRRSPTASITSQASEVPAPAGSIAHTAAVPPASSAPPATPATAGGVSSTPTVARPSAAPPSYPVRHFPGSAANEFTQTLLSAINAARAADGLPPLQWSAGLARSALQHNVNMAAADSLSRQVGDEPALSLREANQGLSSSFAAENVGSSDQQGLAGALAVEARMLAERPPNDAHRSVLLSPRAHFVGISVLADPAHGRLWLTEDFAGTS